MGHHLSAIIGKAPINEEKLKNYQLALAYEKQYAIVILEMYSLAYWMGKLKLDSGEVSDDLPDAGALTFFFAKELGLETYAMIQTDYFAGLGEQHAMLFENGIAISEDIGINQALQKLGVVAEDGKDEFDTLNLGDYRETEGYYYQTGNRANGRSNMIAGRIPENQA